MFLLFFKLLRTYLRQLIRISRPGLVDTQLVPQDKTTIFTPESWDTVLGLKASTSFRLLEKQSQSLVPHQLTIKLQHFRGLDFQYHLTRGIAIFGLCDKLYFRFARPGIAREWENYLTPIQFGLESNTDRNENRHYNMSILSPWATMAGWLSFCFVNPYDCCCIQCVYPVTAFTCLRLFCELYRIGANVLPQDKLIPN